ncbi:DUF2938 family protein [Methylophilus aquaticus]|uniref:DUF2938 family protein n=1 Tax=Methylophilus aquaticus TaxID=1971610 RepID=A0ABT9JS63_9PROT|nr:DUF2938 family protein [Methylophilus aquaticus]MDP8567408.1 DUF2938 family protein [Methylophilus aquaticus]
MNIQGVVFLNGIMLGTTATVLFDLWLLSQKLMGRRVLNFALLGRWIGHFKQLKFVHKRIAEAPIVPLELIIGLIAHYVIGIGIAVLLLLAVHEGWLLKPDIFAALSVGACTVVFPLLIMQPGMGGGLAFTNTASPFKNCLNSLFNHMVFGLCLYLAAMLMRMFH